MSGSETHHLSACLGAMLRPRPTIDGRRVDYIHFNPVKHGHVSQVRDWPYSSFHRYVEQGILPPDWGGDDADFEGEFGE